MEKVFESRFKKILSEEPEVAPAPAPEVAAEPGLTPDQAAMQSTLDQGSEMSDFNVNAPSMEADRLNTQSAQQMFLKLGEWVHTIDEFVEFLNGTGPESMQSILHSSQPDTIFEKVANSQTKKISRSAMDLSSLSEALKGYLVTANDPKYKGV